MLKILCSSFLKSLSQLVLLGKKSIAEGNFPTQCQTKEYWFFVSLLGIVPRLFFKGKKGFCEAIFPKAFATAKGLPKAFFPKAFFQRKKKAF